MDFFFLWRLPKLDMLSIVPEITSAEIETSAEDDVQAHIRGWRAAKRSGAA